MATIAKSKLFQPIKIGNIELKHRIVQAPLTRFRANKEHVHGDLAVEYYSQRASTPGTLIIAEGTLIDAEAGGYDNVPGIWNDAQVAGWKRVTDAVHAKGSFIVLQLWALGRAAYKDVLARDGFVTVSASDIPLAEHAKDGKPKPLTKTEIAGYVQKYVHAANNAVAAGFDGVEVHAANGYLLDQFLQDVSNKRTDEYGGSIENRARFPLEVLDAVVGAVGPERTAIRFSPWSRFQEMRMKDPVPTFEYVIEKIKSKHPNLMYLHLVEPRIFGGGDEASGHEEAEHSSGTQSDHTSDGSNEFALKIWSPRPYISAGGYSHAVEKAAQVADSGENVLAAFGRAFIANPDLPLRIKKGIPLNPYNRDHFYIPESPVGYIDQPFAEENKQ